MVILYQILAAILSATVGSGVALFLGVESVIVIGTSLVLFVAAQITLAPLLVAKLTEPAKIMSQAITQVSNQSSAVKAPNLNTPEYERSGLKTMVQTVYDLALSSDGTATSNKPTNEMGGDFAAQLLNDVPCGIIALDKTHRVVYSNHSAPVHSDSQQQTFIDLMFADNDSLESWLIDCEANKVRDTKTWTSIADKVPGEEDRRVFDVVAYYQKEGAAAETMVITIDRTDSYEPIEEDIDFIAVAAHELRGPITVIRGYLDVLAGELQPVIKDDQAELIRRLQVSSNRLSGYVNNILNVSRFDRRHLKLYPREDRVTDIVDTISDDMSLRAATMNRILSVSIPNNLPTIAADRNSLGEVIINLVDNAIKYSYEGGQIIVGAEAKGDFVEVTVQDFGIGMPASVVGHLFTKFYRSHRSNKSISGSGLGLYISKAIVESHGGKIWTRSTEGQGSTFGFSVPIYSTVADKLKAGNNGNQGIIESSHGWIKNHSMYRG
jgi:two-component system phosphate regulon sensor histidine kinase PhoR/two-component system sensor histidine kinase VicK